MNPRKTLKQWHYLVICLAALAALGATPPDSPITFLDDRQLTINWDLSKADPEVEKVTVCNVGVDPLSGLQASLTRIWIYFYG